jgi:hypothetical protein
MGVSKNTSIGAYLLVHGVITETIEEAVNTCSNEECGQHQSNRDLKGKGFCSVCGSKVAPKIYSKEIKKHARSFLDDLIWDDKFEEDELSWTDPMGCGGGVFIPNYASPFEKERRSNAGKDKILDSYDEVTDLTGINSSEEVDWFKEKYSDLIKQFEDNFGKDNVRVGWGVIEWYS